MNTMTNSILEITENEYLIKLNRSNFDLSFIRSLLKNCRGIKARKKQAGRRKLRLFTMHIADRHIAPNQNHSSEPDYFSSLDEK
jgi:hypothetical protein